MAVGKCSGILVWPGLPSVALASRPVERIRVLNYVSGQFGWAALRASMNSRRTYALQAPTSVTVALRDRSLVGDAWIGGMATRVLEFAVDGRSRARDGAVGTTFGSRGERSILTTAALAF